MKEGHPEAASRLETFCSGHMKEGHPAAASRMKEGHPAVIFLVVPPILEAGNITPDQEDWRLKLWNKTSRDSPVGNTGSFCKQQQAH